MADESIDIRVRLREAAKFKKDTRSSAREVDNLGDQAAQAARKFRQLNRESSNTRVNLGPFSTSVRRIPLLVGAAALATEKWSGSILSLAEAAATAGGGAAAGGAVGLTALAQGTLVAKLGLEGMGDALGGNEDALKRLTPEARSLFAVLKDAQDQMRSSAETGLLPGLIGGGNAAMRNLPVVNKIIEETGLALGGLAQGAGDMVGSKAWGRDLAKIGGTNVKIITNLGEGALDLADAGRHILVEAGPLAEWLSAIAENGAAATESFFKTKRETGELAAFFRRARTDLELLGSATGHGARGIINLFGAQDVDGTRTLRNFDQLLTRFENWSKSPAAQKGVGQAIVDEIPQFADDLAIVLAETFGRAAIGAAGIFWDSFWQASAEGKAVLGAAVLWKTGAFKMLGKGLSDRLGGGSPVDKLVRAGKPLPVFVTNPGFGGMPGGGPRGGPTPTPTRTTPTRPAPTRRLPGGPKVGWAALAVTLGADALLPEGAVRDALFGVQDDDAIRREIAKSFPKRQPVGVGNPNPLNVPPAFAQPFAGKLPTFTLHNHLNLDGREVKRNQRQIDLQDKRRFGNRRG